MRKVHLPSKIEQPKVSGKPPKPERKLRPDVNLDFLNPPKKPDIKPHTLTSAEVSNAPPETEIVTKFVEDVLDPKILTKSEPTNSSYLASLTDPLSLQSSSEASLAIGAIKTEQDQQPQTSYSLDQQTDKSYNTMSYPPQTSYAADEDATAAAGILGEDDTTLTSLPATIPDFNDGYVVASNYTSYEGLDNVEFGQQDYQVVEGNSDINAAFTGEL